MAPNFTHFRFPPIKRIFCTLILFFLFLDPAFAYGKLVVKADANGILYVKKGSTGDGSSWAGAIGELADALQFAKTNPAVEQIWVAGGMYKPLYSADDSGTDLGDPRNRSFLLPDNVKLYGGFAGTENSLESRNLSLKENSTILSGDLDNNDLSTGAPIGNNAYHVVICGVDFGNCFIDGFTVQGGIANGNGGSVINIGRIALGNFSGAGLVSMLRVSTDISNCIFQGNLGMHASAIQSWGGNTNISNTLITGNATILTYGVVLFNTGSGAMVNCTVAGNSSPTGTIYNSGGKLRIHNSIVYGNSAGIAGNAPVMSNCIIQGGYPGTNIGTADPLFMDLPAFSLAPFTGGDYRLRNGSPAINAGNNEFSDAPTSAENILQSMADQFIMVSCSGPACMISDPGLVVTNDNIDDYIQLQASVVFPYDQQSYLEVGWSDGVSNDSTATGFLLSDEEGILNSGNLPGINLQNTNSESGGGHSSGGFKHIRTITIHGKKYKYFSDGILTKHNKTKIVIIKDEGKLNSIRIHGAFRFKAGLNYAISKDIEGKPRFNRQVTDLGAYEEAALEQSIAVNDIITTYGDVDLAPGFIASSGLPVSFQSSDNNIAEAWQDTNDHNSWKIKIKKAGRVSITVSQSGNDDYEAASRSFELTIRKRDVAIQVRSAAIITKVYDGSINGMIAAADLSFNEGGIINNDQVAIMLNNNAITYDNKNAGNNKVITVPLQQIALAGDGAANYRIGIIADIYFDKAVITKYPLTITATASSRNYGEPDPPFHYSPVVLLGEDVFTGALGREPGENAGVYSITIGTLNAGSNYTIDFIPAVFKIDKATQWITWDQNNLETGCSGVSPLQLSAVSNSGLPVTYLIENGKVATITGSTLTPVSGGATIVKAIQAGDQNHEAAATIEKTFRYHLTNGIRQHFRDVLVFDNTGGNYVQWQWYKNGNPIAGATKPYYDNSDLNGSYYVMATDKQGNTVQTCPLTATAGGAESGLKLSPNPVTPGSSFTVTCGLNATALQGAKLIITNVSGAVVQEITTVNTVTQLRSPAFGGVYIITLVLSNGQRSTVNLLVK